MLCDFHIHTCMSADSKADIDRVIQTAIQLGMTYLCITDHHDIDYKDGDIFCIRIFFILFSGVLYGVIKMSGITFFAIMVSLENYYAFCLVNSLLFAETVNFIHPLLLAYPSYDILPEHHHLRQANPKGSGNVGTQGCVSYMFDKKGQIVIDKEECDMDSDELMMLALDSGAEDFFDLFQKFFFFVFLCFVFYDFKQ